MSVALKQSLIMGSVTGILENIQKFYKEIYVQ